MGGVVLGGTVARLWGVGLGAVGMGIPVDEVLALAIRDAFLEQRRVGRRRGGRQAERPRDKRGRIALRSYASFRPFGYLLKE